MKLLGALIVIAGCGGFGFYMAALWRREERILRELGSALDFMGCELQYRMTPLPELCRQTGDKYTGPIREVLENLAGELESQIAPDVRHCMDAALRKTPELPASSRTVLDTLGTSMGRFDLEGQLKGLESARADCRKQAEAMAENRDVRLRSFQTLGLCAGAALAILFL